MEAADSWPVHGGGHECGLNEVFGQCAVAVGQDACVPEQALRVGHETIGQFLDLIRRDLVTGHLSLRPWAVAAPPYPGRTTLKLTSDR